MDILGDATDERYLAGNAGLPGGPGTFRARGHLTHQAMTDPAKVAQALVPEIKKHAKPVLAVWMGGEDVAEGVRILNDGGVPVYETPEQAVDTFMAMYSYTRNLELLQETPAQLPHDLEVNHAAGPDLYPGVPEAPGPGAHEMEAKAILAAYGIPVTPTISASTPQAAAQAANHLGYPVVMKILSPQISHKTDVGGVRVGLKNEDGSQAAFERDHPGMPAPGCRRPRFWG